MFKKLLIVLPMVTLAATSALAQVSYGDRSGYESPRTERPEAPPRETLAPRSIETPTAPPSTQTSTSGTVLEFPAETNGDQVIFYESTEVVPARPAFKASDLPRQGTTQADVRARFGNPVRSFNPVGDPPITRWDYKDFRVFFEYNLVLHAVVPGDFPPISNRDELVSGR